MHCLGGLGVDGIIGQYQVFPQNLSGIGFIRFQRDGASCHIACKTMAQLRGEFDKQFTSRLENFSKET